jgi:hypothetical protein
MNEIVKHVEGVEVTGKSENMLNLNSRKREVSDGRGTQRKINCICITGQTEEETKEKMS